MPYCMGTHAQGTIRRVINQMLDGRERGFAQSTMVQVRGSFFGRGLTLAPSSSATRRTGVPPDWSFIRLARSGDVWVWLDDTDDWRDQVRDIAMSVLEGRGYHPRHNAGRNMADVYTRSMPPARAPRSDEWRTTGALPVRVSSSMIEKLIKWADAGCPVSQRMMSRKYDTDGGGRHAFTVPLIANYLTIRDDGYISYVPKGRWDQLDNPWARAGRQASRPSKLLKSMMTDEALKDLTDKDWEAFASRIKGAAEEDRVTIELVSGDDIRYWYDGDNYANDYVTGDLGNSCMRYDECQSYFDIYTDNPDQVQMLIVKDNDNMLIGRSLVWTTTTGERVHDRIYGSGATQSLVREWFADNDIRRASAGDSVQLDNPWHERYPYFDTFTYITPDGCVHTSSSGLRHAIAHGDTSGGTDLSNGPNVCRECDKVMGWGYSANGICDDCRAKARARVIQEQLDRFRTDPPAQLTYRDYLNLPRIWDLRDHDTGSTLFITDGADGAEVARYAYHPERFNGDYDSLLFDLITADVAVV